jgi:hypothetical protein
MDVDDPAIDFQALICRDVSSFRRSAARQGLDRWPREARDKAVVVAAKKACSFEEKGNNEEAKTGGKSERHSS